MLAAPVKEPWVPNEEEAGMLEAMLAREDAWDASRASKPSWNVGKDAGTTGAHECLSAQCCLCAHQGLP